MSQFKKILLVASRKKEAKAVLRRITRLAEADGAAVTLAATLDWPKDGAHLPDQTLSPDELKRVLAEHHEEELREAIAEAAAGGSNIAVKVFFGRPYVEVIREVLRHGHDLVVKMSEGEGGLESRLFGSQDMDLMRKCPCPVLIIKPSRRRSFGNILVAVDVSDDPDLGLNEQILDAAVPLARAEGGKLFVVNAWSYFAEEFLRTKRGYYEEMDTLLAEIKEQHQQAIDGLLAKHDTAGVSCKAHLLKGSPETVIPQFARENDIDLIVMGTLGRVGLPGMVIGNTAETILFDTDCSVLTLKPKGFVSPVEPR
jgi:nucleotide-binding universal stress UspA family protein